MPRSRRYLLACAIAVVASFHIRGHSDETVLDEFRNHVEPFLGKYCFECHNIDNSESGVRVDTLNGLLDGRTPFLWSRIRRQLTQQDMPPDDAVQPSAAERSKLLSWIDRALLQAKRRPREKNGSFRRLTISQYQRTLQDLLGIDDDFTSLLPPDAVSKDGFLNQEQTMVLSPLLIEAYFQVAERALDQCIVDSHNKPRIQKFRVDFGASINPLPCPDQLILGANSHLLANTDFVVRQLKADKPFDFLPVWMKTKYRFHEGYQGNSTVRGWRDYDSVYHAVFACMRGTDGYPQGNAYDVVPEGLLLRPAIPSTLRFGESSTYGPRANFKIALRELPDHGRFRVTVAAARYQDALLLANESEPLIGQSSLVADLSSSREAGLVVHEAGIYRLDIKAVRTKDPIPLTVTLGHRQFSGRLHRPQSQSSEGQDTVITSALLCARLSAGLLRLTVRTPQSDAVRGLALTRIDESSPAAEDFLRFEGRQVTLGVHVGLRRDCGHTLSPLPMQYRIGASSIHDFVFEDAINNYPRPEVEQNNDNYLAGVREIAVRSEYTDSRDVPRMLVRSVTFEGPYYETWPPLAHRRIFLETNHPPQSEEYASQIIRRFSTRAFRRLVSEEELQTLLAVWRRAWEETQDFQSSIKDTLLVVLTSPQLLFQIEASQSPVGEPLNEFELASKLSYLLWNGPPDKELQDLAREYGLRDQLDAQLQRLLRDPRCMAFCKSFVSQWLSLDKLDVVSTDYAKFPELTTEVKRELRREPIQLFRHLVQQNLPLNHLVQSDFVMANETVASYYGLGDRVESGFQFVPIQHQVDHLGGLLSQAGILAGLSDGRESNPVKRGAWIARKIIGEPPDDPPPNVPELTADDPSLTLRERLELHRNQPGCAQCHQGIDPWGLPLEEFDAGGRYKDPRKETIDARSSLPDGTNVQNVADLKEYLASDRIDQVALSFLHHFATYAVGRELSYNEIEYLREAGVELKQGGYRVQDLMRLVVMSPLFLEK